MKQRVNTNLIDVGSVDSIAHSDDLQLVSMLSLTPPLTSRRPALAITII